MGKVVTCRDVGFDCDGVARGETANTFALENETGLE